MRIGFYARGPVSLPHLPYPKATLLLIEKAMVAAWQIIRDHPEGDFKINDADEDRITRELRTCLTNHVLDGPEVPGFTSEQFTVTREGKFESYNGDHLDDMPDLYITIVRDSAASLPSADGLFVECKPIDIDHPAGSAYCDEGIVRFVTGKYAWALHEALMIGYASPEYPIEKKLKAALDKRKATMKHTGNPRACPDSSVSLYTQHPHITIHERGFIYPSTNTTAPKITIRHLWFDRQ